ncbi:LysR family transcriptional regulator [Mesorhizobium tianshanense]|uniref:DNA-binding transcriptional LysR family regulator n=1 Tax=Mesorhizobium tianshanense TaxID=39844 RepID=A0A562N8G3_9HYPH|nr:LysR family transcriptional regulator [Mesorhizobium tianshanense]TWI28414.1 DNA-binding transcriptional LysR family regulator [Mesorhizobium tianshanense]
MRSSIQLATLNYALVVAEEGSFLRASRRAGIDHSALSKRIRDLEYAIGTTIFHRHTGGVGPTPAGERFLDRLRCVLLDLENTLTLARIGIIGEQQRLSIGSNVILAGRALDAIIEFGRCHPNVTIRLIEGSHPGAALGGTEVDVTVTSSSRSTGGAFELSLWNDNLAIVLASNHSLSTRPVIEWSELDQETLLVRRGEPFLLADAVGSRVQLPTIVEHHVSAGTLLRLVRNGLGVALIHHGDVNRVPEGAVCRKLRIGGKPIQISNFVRWRPDNANPALSIFIAFLRDRYST